jgi:hypothetical protein
MKICAAASKSRRECSKKKTELVLLRPNEPSGEVERAREKIAELERKIGQQQVDLDFFGKPCSESGEHIGRAPSLVRRGLRGRSSAPTRRLRDGGQIFPVSASL